MARKNAKKRLEKSRSESGVKISGPHEDNQGYDFYRVEWAEGGKRVRKRYAEKAEAESVFALREIKAKNAGPEQGLVLSSLTAKQHQEAALAFEKLGTTYKLMDAVSFFLDHHRPPDYEIRLSDAIKLYLDDKERSMIRHRTLKNLRWTLELFVKSAVDPLVHEVKAADISRFLTGFRSRDANKAATLRTWEIHRGALNGLFKWACAKDAATNRPFTFTNPVDEVRAYSARLVREQQNLKVATTSVHNVERLFTYLMTFHEGTLIPAFALLYFAGLRPTELERMAGREKELINLATGHITILAEISKTREPRHIGIRDNLAAWLRAFPGPIIPVGYKSRSRTIRKLFGLTHDEPRHSFVSYRVALFASVERAALEAGNTEAIVRRHYKRLHTEEDGAAFFGIIPDVDSGRATIKPVTSSTRED